MIRTTERGLPVVIALAESELRRPAMQLANDILALCQLSGMRMQVRRRIELAGSGVGTNVIRGLRLATEADVAEAEAAIEARSNDEPDSWAKWT